MVKTTIYIALLSFLLLSCGQPQKKYLSITGEAQGSTFKVTYDDSLRRDFSDSILIILQAFDNELSTYKSDSWISLFNNNEVVSYKKTNYVFHCLNRALDWKKLSGGKFDPTVGMLLKYDTTSPISFDTLLKKERTYFINEETKQIEKSDSSVVIDMNAIAQGYSVDILCEFLARNDIKNYFVEIGGELRVKGLNSLNQPWRVGIESPQSTGDKRNFQHIIGFTNKSMATSGSYRKFIEKDGKKYSHAIDPETGKGVTHQLLSVTVIDETCMDADALATTLLVMGYEKSVDYLKSTPSLQGVSAMFILEDNGNSTIYYHGNFKDYLIQ